MTLAGGTPIGGGGRYLLISSSVKSTNAIGCFSFFIFSLIFFISLLFSSFWLFSNSISLEDETYEVIGIDWLNKLLHWYISMSAFFFSYKFILLNFFLLWDNNFFILLVSSFNSLYTSWLPEIFIKLSNISLFPNEFTFESSFPFIILLFELSKYLFDCLFPL